MSKLILSNYEKVKEWRKRFPEKRKAQSQRYLKKHKLEIYERQHEWRLKNIERQRKKEAIWQMVIRKRNPEKQRIRMMRFRSKQEELLISIAGRKRADQCELCGIFEKTVFDHCHNTGKFRGWLCNRCNRTLGQVKDSTALLLRMIDYLNKGGFQNGKVIISEEKRSTEV